MKVAENQIRVLYLDYDSTITRKSSVPLQLETISKGAAEREGHSETAKAERERCIAEIASNLQNEYKLLCEQLLLSTSSEAFDWKQIAFINDEMAQFEAKWNGVVEQAGVLHGISQDVFLKSANQTEIYPECLEVLSTCAKAGIQIKVISVNWSEAWIRQSLSDKSPLLKDVMNRDTSSFEIFANELEYVDGVSSGNLLKKLQSGKDKGSIMRQLLEEDSSGITLYVGDSLMDLEPLLLADIGIVIGNDETLFSFTEHFRIKMLPTTATNLGAFQAKKQTDGEPLLLTARSWNDIANFLFEGRKPMLSVPRVLIVAGSDSGGGAGIQADLKTCMATGAFGTTAIASITSQNTIGVQAIHSVPQEHVESQLDSILSDIGTDVVKTGMLPSIEIVQAIARKIKDFRISSVVIDPVMVSTSGDELSSNEVADAIVHELFPLATVVTPNIPEAQIISGHKIVTVEDMETAAKAIYEMGPRTVLIKGGHLKQGHWIYDVVYDGHKTQVFGHRRLASDRSHGTGCTLASAIASNLAQGCHVMDAIQLAIIYLQDALRHSTDMDIGTGNQLPFNHGYRLHRWPLGQRSFRTDFDLRLYAITDRELNAKHHRCQADAVRAAIQGGATIVQIREKNVDGQEFLEAVKAAMEVASTRSVPVIVNDRVDVALAANADGVHLGQDDLPIDVVRRMIGPGKILGVSAKTPEEAIAAEAAGADYLGVGAVFPTQSKSSSVIGLEGLRKVCSSVHIPVVAIGGINEDNAHKTIAAGARGIAVISAIFDSPDITTATSHLKRLVE